MIAPRLAQPAVTAAISLLVVSQAGAQPDPFAGHEPDLDHGRFVVVGGSAEPGESDPGGVACMSCHGLDGAGSGGAAFPRLADQSAWYLYKALKDYAARRRDNPIMTPIAQALTDAEMRDVAAYYAAIEDAPYPPRPAIDLRTLQHGARLVTAGSAEQGVQACVYCHGVEGTGLPPSIPYLAGQYASYTSQQLLLWRRGERGGDPLNVMRRIAERLTDEDIAALSLYFAAIRPAIITPEPEPPIAPEAALGGAVASDEPEGAQGPAMGVPPERE